MEDHQAINVMEAALLCADAPMTVAALQRVFEPEEVAPAQIESWLSQLQSNWHERGLELAEISTGWRFQSKASMQRFLEKLNPERTPKYSRAVLETLAIIAWKQPVTRADIEAIRGVTVSSQIIKTLEERGWVETLGHRDGPGRPALLGTTKHFLDDLGLRALDELPPLQPLAPVRPEASSSENAKDALTFGAGLDDEVQATPEQAMQNHDLELNRSEESEQMPAQLQAHDLIPSTVSEESSQSPDISADFKHSMDLNPSLSPSVDTSEQK